MKRNINIILPIVLAILLPGLSLYAHAQSSTPNNFGFYTTWLLTSIFFYNQWYLLWHLWDIRQKYQDRKFLFKLAAFCLGLILSLVCISYAIQEFQFNHSVRFIFTLFLCLAIQFALKTQESLSQLQLEKEQIQTENYKAQLKVLHAKIDPHFLFNSLNTLRSMVRQKHGNSEKFILSLADFYRQTLKYNENTKLRLSEELTVLESYLFLMKSRYEEAVNVNINIEKTLLSFFLPTLALQVIVENCFKHNSMTSKMQLLIDISSTDDGYIEVKNNIQPKFGTVESTGYGLDLLVKRYELMGVSNGIVIEETPDEFCVKLKLIN
ncbi:MAG: histidine kinase [Bacteroidia bacterium]|nr:histidine kinase [Bacteroidia bacterium]